MKDASASVESRGQQRFNTVTHCMIDGKYYKHLGKEHEATGATRVYLLDGSKR